MWNPEEVKRIANKALQQNNLPEHFCIIPWSGIEARTDSKACVCCVMQEPFDGINLAKDSITDAWNSDHLKEIRESFMKGEQRKSCSNCWHEEKSGIASKRQMELFRYHDKIQDILSSHEYPLYLDLKLGNICNSKCRICDSFASSKWAQEQLDHGYHAPKKHLENGRWPRANENFWNDLENHVHNLSNIEFFGGEPLMIKEHERVLRKCVELGVAKDITISYNTNGTIWKPELIDVWKEFKHVQLLFSIDGIGKRFEYLRHPAKWAEVEQNIHRYKEHVHVGIFCTVSAFNVWYIPEVCDWAETCVPDVELHFNKVFAPDYYSTKCLPESVKHRAKHHLENNKHYSKIQPWVEFMFTEQHGREVWEEHLKRRRQSDEYRGESFADTFSEFYEVQRSANDI